MIRVRLLGAAKVAGSMWAADSILGMRFQKGVAKAGQFVKRESQKIVPVDTRFLRNSAFSRNIGGKGWRADQIVGYGAWYAIYVHERLDLRHAPGKQAKYLEVVIKTKQADIFRIVYNSILTGV